MYNKKIKNATPTEYNNIQFKSKQEVNSYKRLIEAGFMPEYEKTTYTLVPKLTLSNVLYYIPHKIKVLVSKSSCLPLTYTPDFEFNYKGYTIFYEIKGRPNDTYPLKRKLFLKYLDENNIKSIFFEPHNLNQIDTSITILHELPKLS